MRAKNDDMPIIGDYSEDRKARPRADSRETQSPPPARRADSQARDERLAPDPHDVRRHARLVRQREHRGPFAKVLRYSPIALVAAVAFAVYWNFETLRGITVDYSALTSLFDGDVSVSGEDSRFGTELQDVSVEAPVVVGDTLADDEEDVPETPDAQAVETSRDVLSASSAVASTIASAPASPAEQLADAGVSPLPPTPPPAPPVPETIVFARAVNTVSESDAAAAVLVLRNGGNRGASSFTWWTSDGTATAGVDYADLGRVAVQFAPGEQNRTIRIPIVGDRVVEQPENFYVHLATSEGADASERTRTEVVIEDDD